MFRFIALFNFDDTKNRTWYEYFYSYIDKCKVYEIHTSQWWWDLWSNHYQIILIGALSFICIGGVWYLYSLQTTAVGTSVVLKEVTKVPASPIPSAPSAPPIPSAPPAASASSLPPIPDFTRLTFDAEKAEFLNVTRFLKQRDVMARYIPQVKQIDVKSQGGEQTFKDISEILYSVIENGPCSNCKDYVEVWAVSISSYILKFFLNTKEGKSTAGFVQEIPGSIRMVKRIHYPDDTQTALLLGDLLKDFSTEYFYVILNMPF